MRPTVVASFADREAARRAIEAVQNAGIDGVHITLLGDMADRARAATATEIPDRRAAARATTRVAAGVGAGALAGALAGLVVGAAVVAVTDFTAAAVVAWAVVAGIGFGAAVVPLLALERGLPKTEAWDLTIADVPDGAVAVGVHAPDPPAHRRAVEALRRRGPLRLDEPGRPTGPR